MGFYRKYILPHIIDLAMRNKDAARLRAVWIPRARGEVLEIGIGSGLNLPFYSSDVKHIHGIDPSWELHQIDRNRTVEQQLQAEFHLQSAEESLPVPEESIDTVVSTWTLCSIPNVFRALEHMKRALKKDGYFIFIEHGRAPDTRVSIWQDRLTPLWKRITGGCHLNRKIDDLIASAGFRIVELKTCYLPGPRPMTYTYQGMAQRV